MPEHIRALFVILFLSTIIFAFARQPASEIIRSTDFIRRRNLWFALTLLAFLAQDIWIYILIAGALMIYSRTRESNPVALFFLLLFVVPLFKAPIPGMGLVNYIFDLSHQRLLALVLLLPAYLALASQKQTLPFGRTIADKLLAAYLILIIILYIRESPITDTFRFGFYQFIDVFLPYYVVSRLLRDTRGFREALLCFVVAVMILVLIGLFEAIKHWLLYEGMRYSLGIHGTMSAYGARAGLQRAAASVGPIPLGYVATISIGFFFYLQNSISSKFSRRSGLLLLITGLLASLSRGPWVGAVFLFMVFIGLGRYPTRQLVKFFLAGVAALSLVAILPGGERFINLLPFAGKSGQGTISYREKLIENSFIVIKRNPWFGSVDALNTPEMEAMRQGQGIIDVVNNYIGVALSSGFIGLGLFTGFFLSICWGIYRALRRSHDKNSEEYLLGRALLAVLASILIIIGTVSSVSIIPIVYWSVAGLGAAYIAMMNRLRSTQNEQSK